MSKYRWRPKRVIHILLPPDAKIIEQRHKEDGTGLVIRVESSTYPEVPEGSLIPYRVIQ